MGGWGGGGLWQYAEQIKNIRKLLSTKAKSDNRSGFDLTGSTFSNKLIINTD